MRTLNYLYNNCSDKYSELMEFILVNNIHSEKNVLIQVFTAINNEKFINDLLKKLPINMLILTSSILIYIYDLIFIKIHYCYSCLITASLYCE